jgi:hypothetical protein
VGTTFSLSQTCMQIYESGFFIDFGMISYKAMSKKLLKYVSRGTTLKKCEVEISVISNFQIFDVVGTLER